jgi:cytochrome P450
VNLTFWVLSYILFDPHLHSVILQEIKPAFAGEEVDVNLLCNGCPLLESVYLESLRLSSGAMSGRRVAIETTVGNKILKPGGLMIVPFRQLHYNQNVWGSQPMRFDPERFLKNPKLSDSASYRPFGGGISYCPGRNLAKAEVLMFVATTLARFQARLPTEVNGKLQEFPLQESNKPSTGIAPCLDGTDILIDVYRDHVKA